MIRETVSNIVSNNSLEHLWLNDSTTKDENPEVAMCAQYLEASPQVSRCQVNVEILKVEEKPLTDEEQAPNVKLKPLPSFLRCEFLGPNFTCPTIVNACQIDSLLRP